MSNFLKGKFVEYALRKIMHRCGFTGVRPDGIYIYERHPILYINGKGAAHDADVLMEPPIQMPFAYPTRILFECKAYDIVDLPMVRNVLALRQDINDFEIVTQETISRRQNNRRAQVSIANRKRHYYQAGIATLSGFTRPAIEFAANNKIPLFSLASTFRNSNLTELINQIPTDIKSQLNRETFEALTQLLSSKNINENAEENVLAQLVGHGILGDILSELNSQINRIHVGVLESGELIFITRDLTDDNFNDHDILTNSKGMHLTARIHWQPQNRELWSLEFPGESVMTYSFYLPFFIANSWAAFQQERIALDIKANQFSRIFVFSKSNNNQLPFNSLTLDLDWINDLRVQLETER